MCAAGSGGRIERTAALAIGPPVAGLKLRILALGIGDKSGQ